MDRAQNITQALAEAFLNVRFDPAPGGHPPTAMIPLDRARRITHFSIAEEDAAVSRLIRQEKKGY